jgi:alpha-amylase
MARIYTMKKALIAGLLLVSLTVMIAPSTAQDVTPPATDTQATNWWNARVFYEIFVRSFQDSDGDGIGDLQGVISKLDYLNDGDPNTTTDLGVTGIWLMPIMESPSYHGYDVVDYLKVESDYGTNEDFKQLMTEAHKRGIAVIVDMVINHTSARHPWFLDAKTPGSQHDDWYIWKDNDPKQIGPWGQKVWYPLDNRYYYAVFWDQMPDLNLRNPTVTEAVYDIADFWLTDMDADGFRLDAIKHYVEMDRVLQNAPDTFTWLQSWDSHIESIVPNTFTVGEVFGTSFESRLYVKKGVDITFDFDLARAFINSAYSGNNQAVNSVQNSVFGYYPPSQYGAFLSNHDQKRVMVEFKQDTGMAKVAASMMLTNPGVPFIYYGEEIGMIGDKPDECIRTPMQWEAAIRETSFMAGKNCKTNAKQFNVAAQTADSNSLLSHYRNLIGLRNQHSALRTGEFKAVFSSAATVYSFVRYDVGEALLMVINLSPDVVRDYGLTLEQGPFSGEPDVKTLFGEGTATVPTFSTTGGFNNYVPLPELQPYSTTIIQLNQPG